MQFTLGIRQAEESPVFSVCVYLYVCINCCTFVPQKM